MEREKQRKLEREQQMKEREEMLRLKIIEEEEALAEANDGQPMIPKKSKFVSCSYLSFSSLELNILILQLLLPIHFFQESDSEEEETHAEGQKLDQDKRKSRFSDAESPGRKGRSPTPEPDEPPKNKEEIMQEVVCNKLQEPSVTSLYA